MKALTKIEVTEFLSVNLPGWSYNEGSIKREFKFKTFVEAFSFMTAVAMVAEKSDHHPDWNNVYNRVSIHLYTHDANGITKSDFDLAGKIDKIFSNYPQAVP